MRNIGFYGGNTIFELGPITDVLVFFWFVSWPSVERQVPAGLSLINDRLYRRYLRAEELADASTAMSHIKKAFSKMPCRDRDWVKLGFDAADFEPPNTELDYTKLTIADLFDRYFHNFDRAVSRSQHNLGRGEIYHPVMTIISDTPRFVLEASRKLEQFDNREGDPFWMSLNPDDFKMENYNK